MVVSKVGAFKPQDTIKRRPSDPGTPRNISSQTQGQTKPLPTTNAHYNASFALRTDPPSQSSAIELDLDKDSSTGDGGNRRQPQGPGAKNVNEFRNVIQNANGPKLGRSRRRPTSDTSIHSQRPPKRQLVSLGRSRNELGRDPICDDDELAGDFRSCKPATKCRSAPVDLTQEDSPKQKGPRHNPIPQHTVNYPVTIKDAGTGKRTRIEEVDEADELNDQELYGPKKKPRLQSGNLKSYSSPKIDSRADIKPTKFSSTSVSHAASSPISEPELHINLAFRGPNYLCEEEQVLKLESSAPDQVIHAYQPDLQERSAHSDWLVINFVQTIKVTWNHSNLQVIVLLRSGNSLCGKPLNPSLYLQFKTLRDMTSFVDWFKSCHKSKTVVKIDQVEPDVLTKRFDKQNALISQENKVRIKRAPQEVPQDVQLQQVNQNRRASEALGLCGEHSSPKATRKPKLVDGLLAQTGLIVIDADEETRANRSAVPTTQRALRSRQTPDNTFGSNYKPFRPDSRSPSPKLKSKLWTEENAGWDKEWRVDLSQYRTTIHKGDIARLDEGELLNDSIISFYLQYLHEKVQKQNPATTGRFYFQSSFFWDRLKSTNRKEINYDKVKSWTNRVDLFAYDYVVVPVNENSHWYVAVICNPGKLLRKGEKPPMEESLFALRDEIGATGDKAGLPGPVREASDVPSTLPQGASVTASSHFSPRTDMANNMDLLSLERTPRATVTPIAIPDDDETSPSSILKTSSTEDNDDDHVCLVRSDLEPQSRPRRTTAQGLDVEDRDLGEGFVKIKESAVIPEKEACIITFDSLGISHSPVCTALKKYLQLEAKDKKGLDIEMPNMGRTAKHIPHQNNYWDCGVYLMSYVEALMRDPEEFIRKSLPRKAGSCDFGDACEVDALAMRNLIRSTILEQQKSYQKKVEDEAEAKKARKQRKAQGLGLKGVGSSPAPVFSSQLTSPNSPAHAASSLPAQSENAIPSIESPTPGPRASTSTEG